MIRYIPDFILQQYEKKQLSGSFSGYALFFDIADFTSIGTLLQKHGKEGAEELSRFLDYMFGEPIRCVERNGGFVSLFAGDAFCAIFPEASEMGILATADAIREYFSGKESYHTPLGDFTLKVRFTASYGDIHWQIYDNPIQSEYVFHGDPLSEIAILSSKKEDCIFSEDAARKLGLEHFEAIDIGFKPITKGFTAEPLSISYSHTPETYQHFLQQRLFGAKPDNEIRSAAFCFASLEAIPREERNEAVYKLAAFSLSYGAYINKLDATDKGLTALILFGLPRSEGKTLERICSFALEAVEALPLITLGISCGSVFAGFCGSGEISEYTALGHPLNLAARLMSKARAGEVLTDAYLWQELHAAYDFGYLGSLGLEGIEKPIRYYRLKRQAKGERDENSFVGRDTELQDIRETIDNALADRENIIIYVSGDAGIGKSRLVSEALAVYKQPKGNAQSQYQFTFISCDAILRKPLEAIKQMLRSQFYYNPSLPPEAAIPMFRVLWGVISPGDSEMQRIESFLASLLGYEWGNSIWSMLPAEERPKQLKNAFVYYLSKLCQSKAIIIHLDDGQCLDEESKDYFQAISKAELCPVIFISPCRYLEDGSKADLQLPGHRRIDIELDSLSENSCVELSKSILRLHEIPIATQELIFNRSMGNPLFIEQLSAYLMETGSLSAKGVIVQELGYLSSFSISDIVSNRIDRLTDKVKECLFGASVLGMEFNIKVLSEMLKTDLSQELETGTQSRIWKDLDELRYIFSHILIKDIVYQRMVSDKLKQLHQLAAEAMEIVYKDKLDENAEEIAYHFEKAGMEMETAKYFNLAGSWFSDNYNWEKGEPLLKIALSIRQKVLGEEHPNTANTLTNLAILYHDQGKYEQAVKLHLRALEIREKVLGDKHPDTAASLNNIAIIYVDQGKYDKAEPLFLQVLKIWEKVLGVEHPDTALSLNNLANLYVNQGKYDKAEPMILRALKIWEKEASVEHTDMALSLYNLAKLYKNQGKYDLAEQLYIRALDIRESDLGMEHPATAALLTGLANLYNDQGKYEQAEPLILRALEIQEKFLGVVHSDTAASLNGLANLYKGQGKDEQAEPLILRALEIYEKLFGAEHPDTAALLNNLANIYVDQGIYDKAESLCLRALEIYEKVLGVEHPDTSRSLNNLAILYVYQGKFEQAEPLNLRALEIHERFFGGEHPDTAKSLYSLAFQFKSQGKYEQAEPLYLRALEIQEMFLGAEHLDTVALVNSLACLYLDQGKYEQAEPLLLQALEAYKKTLGAEHHFTAITLSNLGQLYTSTGKLNKAEQMLLNALGIFLPNLGVNHPWTQEAINVIIELYEKMNLSEKAAQYQAMLPQEDVKHE